MTNQSPTPHLTFYSLRGWPDPQDERIQWCQNRTGRHSPAKTDDAEDRPAVFWIGVAAMLIAVLMQFGWPTALFCAGGYLAAAGRQ